MSEESAIHKLLGSLKADMESSQRQRSTLFEKVDSIAHSVAILCADHKAHVSRADIVREDVGKLEKRVNSLEIIKSRIIGAGLVLTATSGAAWDAAKGLFRS